jgi:hypothetical protein
MGLPPSLREPAEGAPPSLPDAFFPSCPSVDIDMLPTGATSFSLGSLDAADSAGLEFEIVEGPVGGVLEGQGPNLAYKPQLPYRRGDSFVYRVKSGGERCVPGRVSFRMPSGSVLVANLPDYLTLPLPTGVSLKKDIPLTDSNSNPPGDLASPSLSPLLVGTAVLQSVVKRPGKLYSGFAPGASDGSTSGRWTFGVRSADNSLHRRSFAVQAWAYLPASGVTGTFSWFGNEVLGENILYGGGGPDREAPRFGVGRIVPGGTPKLIFGTATNRLASDLSFPLDTWVHVAVVHDETLGKSILYMNGIVVDEREGLFFEETGPIAEYNLGSAEYNGSWSRAWRGYISNFRLYLP